MTPTVGQEVYNAPFRDLTFYVISVLVNLVTISVVGWFTYVIKGFTKDITRLDKTIDAHKEESDQEFVDVRASIDKQVEERNKKVDKIQSSIDSYEEAMLSLSDKLHACQLTHLEKVQDILQRSQKAELRSTDLKRIGDSLEQLFALMRASDEKIGGIIERLAKVEVKMETISHTGLRRS